MDALWHPCLVEMWEVIWGKAVKRHHEWCALGMWKLGMPKKLQTARTETYNDMSVTLQNCYANLVEYLLLRDARDSLPPIG